MYFSRITLSPLAGTSEILRQLGPNGYQTHKIIWRFFADSPDRRRDFIYRFDNPRNGPIFYVVSARKPLDQSSVWKVETKEYFPILHIGQKMEFKLRVNPIITRHDENGRQKRHDVVMDLKKRMAEKKQSLDGDIRTIAGLQWLISRAEQNGFIFKEDLTRVDSCNQFRFFKSRKHQPVSISVMDFSGIIEVTDPERLAKALVIGIGPAKSFGCGLLMIRRI